MVDTSEAEPMQREIWEAHLRLVEWRAALAERSIAEQVRHIAELERQGQDARQARKWLAQFEELLSQHVAHRDRLKRDLYGLKQRDDAAEA